MPENSKYGQAHGKQFQGLTERAQIALSHYDWPGNVRELENVFSSAAISASGAFIDVGDFPVVNEDNHQNKDEQGCEKGVLSCVLARLLGPQTPEFSHHIDTLRRRSAAHS